MSIEAAIKTLEEERKRIDAALRALGALAPTTKASGGVSGGGKKKRRKMSPEARKRIADAQRARWAKQKAKK